MGPQLSALWGISLSSVSPAVPTILLSYCNIEDAVSGLSLCSCLASLNVLVPPRFVHSIYTPALKRGSESIRLGFTRAFPLQTLILWVKVSIYKNEIQFNLLNIFINQ